MNNQTIQTFVVTFVTDKHRIDTTIIQAMSVTEADQKFRNIHPKARILVWNIL